METQPNRYVMLLTHDLSILYIIPLLGYLNDTVVKYRNLCKATRKFINENLENISCSVLKDSNDKLYLKSKLFSSKLTRFLN